MASWQFLIVSRDEWHIYEVTLQKLECFSGIETETKVLPHLEDLVENGSRTVGNDFQKTIDYVSLIWNHFVDPLGRKEVRNELLVEEVKDLAHQTNV